MGCSGGFARPPLGDLIDTSGQAARRAAQASRTRPEAALFAAGRAGGAVLKKQAALAGLKNRLSKLLKIPVKTLVKKRLAPSAAHFFPVFYQRLTWIFGVLLRTATTTGRNHYNNGAEPLQQRAGTVTTRCRNRYNKRPEPLQQSPSHLEPLQQAENGSRGVLIHRTEPLQQRSPQGAHTMQPHFGDNLG